MTLDLARLEALAAAATPGPWSWSPAGAAIVAGAYGVNGGVLGCDHRVPTNANAAFIAACDPTTVQALCERIRALEAVAEAARRFDAALAPQEIWDAEDALEAALARLDATP